MHEPEKIMLHIMYSPDVTQKQSVFRSSSPTHAFQQSHPETSYSVLLLGKKILKFSFSFLVQ